MLYSSRWSDVYKIDRPLGASYVLCFFFIDNILDLQIFANSFDACP